MVTIEVKNIGGNTILPVAGSNVAAGYDIVAIDDPVIIGEVGNVKEVDGKQVTFYRSIDYIQYHTGLFISPQSISTAAFEIQKFHTLIYPRSSVRKYNLSLANSIGLIDNDYRGELLVCFNYVWQPDDLVMETTQVATSDGGKEVTWEITGRMLGKINYDKVYKKGDKIAQLVIDPTIHAEFKLVNELDTTERGQGGFGSTDAPTVKGQFIKISETSHSGRVYPQKVMDKEIKKLEESTGDGSLKEFKTMVENLPGTSIAEIYKKSGGIPVKKPYSQEIKERDRKK